MQGLPPLGSAPSASTARFVSLIFASPPFQNNPIGIQITKRVRRPARFYTLAMVSVSNPKQRFPENGELVANNLRHV